MKGLGIVPRAAGFGGVGPWLLLVGLISVLLLVARPRVAIAAEPAHGVESAPLQERFAHPPLSCRILQIIHNWPDDPAQQDALRERLLAQGFGGVVCNVSFTDYLDSAAKWRAFTRAVGEARKAGMALWLYDERGYPSGNAGGQVLRDHPEWEAQGLLIADTECGPGPVKLEVPPGRLRLAAAYPASNGALRLEGRVNLTGQVKDSTLAWDAPAGRWQVLAVTESRLYDGTHAALNLHEKLPYPNLLLAAPTARFLQLTHDRYARELGADLGRSFVATFTDEPSLMSLFLRRMPYRPLPWSPQLAAEFQHRRGYALEPVLPSLVVDTGPDAARHRHDFWLTVGELVSENYFGQIQRWCARHALPSGGHLLAEENLANHVPLYGDFFRCVRRLDAPSIDCLTSLPPDVPWYIARLVASAAELEGKTLVMCETSDHGQVWRPPGDSRPKRVVTEAEIRGTCNRLMVAGVNTITSYYSFTALSDDQLRRLNDWVGRCATLLRGGRQAADIAVVYPAESLWTRFVPSRHWSREAAGAFRVESLYRSVTDALFAARRDFTVIDSRTIREAKIDSGALVHGPLRWRVVVLPGIDTLPLEAWRKLGQFAARGGVIVDVSARPANSEAEFPCAKVLTMADRVFGPASVVDSLKKSRAGGAGVILTAGTVASLPSLLDRCLEPDVKVAGAAAPLRVTHREVDGHAVYFLINDSARPWEGEVAFRAGGPFERWDPATGTTAVLGRGPKCWLAFEPYGAVFVRCGPGWPPRRRVGIDGALSALSLQSLPELRAELAHGEFVRAELTPDPGHGTPERPAWQAQATLTREQVKKRLVFVGPLRSFVAIECRAR